MKILTTIVFLIVSSSFFAQNKPLGRYRDYFGSRIQLNADNTFRYTCKFDLFVSWSKGTWKLIGDTVYFYMVPTYDTLTAGASDSLIVSVDEKPERFTQTQFASTLLALGGQDIVGYPSKLLFRKSRLYKIRNGKLVTKREKGFWTKKKWDPWFFKSDD